MAYSPNGRVQRTLTLLTNQDASFGVIARKALGLDLDLRSPRKALWHLLNHLVAEEIVAERRGLFRITARGRVVLAEIIAQTPQTTKEPQAHERALQPAL